MNSEELLGLMVKCNIVSSKDATTDVVWSKTRQLLDEINNFNKPKIDRYPPLSMPRPVPKPSQAKKVRGKKTIDEMSDD